MPEFVYRFRPSYALLARFQELERQEIYFSPTDDLNDPVEGFKDIFWSGDAIVWKNLLRHYLLCLCRVCSALLIGGEDFEIKESHYWVFGSDKHLETDAYRDVFRDICEAFFASERVGDYAPRLAARKYRIRRNELLFHLYQLHAPALKAVFSAFASHKLARPITEADPIYVFLQSAIVDPDDLASPEMAGEEPQNSADSVFAFANNFIVQARLAHKYRSVAQQKSRNQIHVYSEFPERYLKAIERIVHPPWAVACFVADPRSASMWGHYGESHKGMCLKFKTSTVGEDSFLTLNGINGVYGERGKPTKLLHGDIRLKFYPIKYQDHYPEIDFFRSMGRLPLPTLFNFWYRGDDGQMSTCAEHMTSTEVTTQWRTRYWNDFNSIVTTKLTDWNYERELRLLRTEDIVEHYEIEHRKLNYQFKDLDGIIFGIRTSDADKLAVLQIIEKKCKENDRADFNLYQAVYSQSQGKIEIVPMDGLRIFASQTQTSTQE
jgi:hypothetical protein